MVVRTIEMLLEYAAIILCIHKLAGLKVGMNKWNIVLGVIDYIVMMLVSYGIISPYIRCGIYVLIVIYIKLVAKESWNKAISIFGSVMIAVVSLQFVVFYLFKIMHLNLSNPGILINGMICVVCCIWRQRYFFTIIKYLNAAKGIIISLLYALVFIQIIYLNENEGYLRMEMVIQFLAETIGLSIVSLLWIGAEIKHKQKVKEVQMYELYNQAFEETIMTIRARQHEFENHINTLRCLQYTIDDKDELFKAQEQYYSSILQDSSIKQLLKLHIEPVLVGFLYSKIIVANEKGVTVKYDIQPVEINKYILMYELIEIVGILFDNALEAIAVEKVKIIILRIMNEESGLCFEVANKSRFYQNYEIEKFVKDGFSTKGKERGVGLTRVREIAKKYRAALEIGNYEYESENYLRVRIKFVR